MAYLSKAYNNFMGLSTRYAPVDSPGALQADPTGRLPFTLNIVSLAVPSFFEKVAVMTKRAYGNSHRWGQKRAQVT